jgi:hypothetical protein
MRIRSLFGLIVFISLAAISGCGGSGDSGSTSATTTPTTSATVITGVASKGIIKNGTVKVFALNSDGSKGTLLKEMTSDINGGYTADIGTYTGPVLVEASGSYIDEATGSTKTIPADAPLRAAVGNASGAVTIAVTPLTELAVKKVEDPVSRKLLVSGIETANTSVSGVFKVDIVKTLPVDATAAAPSDASQTQKEYALLLAAISQMMKANGQDLIAVLTQLNSSISIDNKLSTQTAVAFQTALSDFAHSDMNKTGITDITATNLVAIGGSSALLKLSTQGTLAGGSSIGGIEVTVNLPAGVTVKADTSGTLVGVVTTSGVVPTGSLVQARYIPASGIGQGSIKIALIEAMGFGIGEFVTVNCDVSVGAIPSAIDFSLTDFKPVDLNSAAIAGLSVTFTADIK